MFNTGTGSNPPLARGRLAQRKAIDSGIPNTGWIDAYQYSNTVICIERRARR